MQTRLLTEAATLLDYIKLAQVEGILSPDGDYLILKKVFGKGIGWMIWHGLTLAEVNMNCLFFTSEEAAQNYFDICYPSWEPDLPYNGGFIVKRIKSLPGRKSIA